MKKGLIFFVLLNVSVLIESSHCENDFNFNLKRKTIMEIPKAVVSFIYGKRAKEPHLFYSNAIQTLRLYEYSSQEIEEILNATTIALLSDNLLDFHLAMKDIFAFIDFKREKIKRSRSGDDLYRKIPKDRILQYISEVFGSNEKQPHSVKLAKNFWVRQ